MDEDKIKAIEDHFKGAFHKEHRDFLIKLTHNEILFSDEPWFFSYDEDLSEYENFVIRWTRDFRNEFNLNYFVIADNGLGDYLLVSDSQVNEDKRLLIMLHEMGQIKVYANSLENALNSEIREYMVEDWIYRINSESHTEINDNYEEGILSKDGQESDPEYELRFNLMNIYDEEETDRSSELLSGLEELLNSNEPIHKIWALRTLSKIYLKGFGPIPLNHSKAVSYLLRAVEENDYMAMADLAAAYFAGIGVERDLNKSLSLLEKANQLSKNNMFSDIISGDKSKGMFEELLEIIKKEIENQK